MSLSAMQHWMLLFKHPLEAPLDAALVDAERAAFNVASPSMMFWALVASCCAASA